MSSQYGVIETDFDAYCITKNSTNLQTNSSCRLTGLQLCEMMSSYNIQMNICQLQIQVHNFAKLSTC